jgi:hypothetical protein
VLLLLLLLLLQAWAMTSAGCGMWCRRAACTRGRMGQPELLQQTAALASLCHVAGARQASLLQVLPRP